LRDDTTQRSAPNVAVRVPLLRGRSRSHLGALEHSGGGRADAAASSLLWRSAPSGAGTAFSKKAITLGCPRILLRSAGFSMASRSRRSRTRIRASDRASRSSRPASTRGCRSRTSLLSRCVSDDALRAGSVWTRKTPYLGEREAEPGGLTRAARDRFRVYIEKVPD
jgi:hypothetical protein